MRLARIMNRAKVNLSKWLGQSERRMLVLPALALCIGYWTTYTYRYPIYTVKFAEDDRIHGAPVKVKLGPPPA